MLTALHHGPGVIGGGDGELDLDHAPGEPVQAVIARGVEHGQHRAVVGHRLGHEPDEPVLTSGRGEVLEHQGTEAAPLVGVVDGEGHLGVGAQAAVVTRQAVVARHCDDLGADERRQRHTVDVIDGGEVRDLLVGEHALGAEEPVVAGLGRQAVEEPEVGLAVGGEQGPDVDGPAVAEDHVEIPVRRVGKGVAHGENHAPAVITLVVVRRPGAPSGKVQSARPCRSLLVPMAESWRRE